MNADFDDFVVDDLVGMEVGMVVDSDEEKVMVMDMRKSKFVGI
jgi:hypothetical protein